MYFARTASWMPPWTGQIATPGLETRPPQSCQRMSGWAGKTGCKTCAGFHCLWKVARQYWLSAEACAHVHLYNLDKAALGYTSSLPWPTDMRQFSYWLLQVHLSDMQLHFSNPSLSILTSITADFRTDSSLAASIRRTDASYQSRLPRFTHSFQPIELLYPQGLLHSTSTAHNIKHPDLRPQP